MEAGYAFVDTELVNGLHLEMSGRVEHVAVSGTPVSDVAANRSFTPLSGALGALFEVSDAVKIGATFSSTGRAPGSPNCSHAVRMTGRGPSRPAIPT